MVCCKLGYHLCDIQGMKKQSLMPIGRFSKACRLSIKALRHYDEQGLLVPSYIDPVTHYRYYERHQARQAVMISMLRSLKLPLTRISDMLSADEDELRYLLSLEQQRLTKELEQKKQALSAIERLADAGKLLPYEINLREEPDYVVARLSTESDAEHMIEAGVQLVYALYHELQQAGRDYVDPVMCINEDPDQFEKITIHACIGIEAPFPDLETASMETLRGGTMAWLTHKGAYEELGLAYHALAAWAQERGHEQSSAMREIYLNDPTDTPVDELITEVLLPLKTNNG